MIASALALLLMQVGPNPAQGAFPGIPEELRDRPVESIMYTPFPVVDSHPDAEAAAPLLTRKNSAVLVRDEGEINGILTRYDLIRNLTGSIG